MPATFVEAKRNKRNRRAAKIRAMATAIKLARGCIDCGYNAHPAALDFDHVRGEKKRNVSLFSTTQKGLLEEIAKCDVRCANCHRVKTWTESIDCDARPPLIIAPWREERGRLKKLLTFPPAIEKSSIAHGNPLSSP